ncbi:hypothetical protein DIPPA_24984 [Diplonema papillatum]|nr:hypothetical protein DIPPA_24984 [Diplonema papillatum]
MMVLKTALKAGWSLAGLQHRHQHEAGFPPYLRNVFQALQRAEDQPAPKPSRKRSPKSRTQHSGEAHPRLPAPSAGNLSQGEGLPWTVSHLLWRGDADVLSCRSPRSPPTSGNILFGPQRGLPECCEVQPARKAASLVMQSESGVIARDGVL